MYTDFSRCVQNGKSSHHHSPSPPATPAVATTAVPFPAPSQLSPLAEPFFPSSGGCSKSQRWLDSPPPQIQ